MGYHFVRNLATEIAENRPEDNGPQSHYRQAESDEGFRPRREKCASGSKEEHPTTSESPLRVVAHILFLSMSGVEVMKENCPGERDGREGEPRVDVEANVANRPMREDLPSNDGPR